MGVASWWEQVDVWGMLRMCHLVGESCILFPIEAKEKVPPASYRDAGGTPVVGLWRALLAVRHGGCVGCWPVGCWLLASRVLCLEVVDQRLHLLCCLFCFLLVDFGGNDAGVLSLEEIAEILVLGNCGVIDVGRV